MKKIFSFLLVLAIITTVSCRFLREKKAEHHQPFNGSHEKKPQHKKHKGTQHHH